MERKQCQHVCNKVCGFSELSWGTRSISLESDLFYLFCCSKKHNWSTVFPRLHPKTNQDGSLNWTCPLNSVKTGYNKDFPRVLFLNRCSHNKHAENAVIETPTRNKKACGRFYRLVNPHNEDSFLLSAQCEQPCKSSAFTLCLLLWDEPRPRCQWLKRGRPFLQPIRCRPAPLLWSQLFTEVESH